MPNVDVANARLVPLHGSRGWVVRVPHAVAFVATTDEAKVSDLLSACEGASSSAEVLGRVVGRLSGSTEGWPPFGLVTSAEGGLVVLVHGSASVAVTSTEDKVDKVTAEGEGRWLTRTIPDATKVELGEVGSGTKVEELVDLRAGLLPAQGGVLVGSTRVVSTADSAAGAGSAVAPAGASAGASPAAAASAPSAGQSAAAPAVGQSAAPGASVAPSTSAAEQSAAPAQSQGHAGHGALEAGAATAAAAGAGAAVGGAVEHHHDQQSGADQASGPAGTQPAGSEPGSAAQAAPAGAGPADQPAHTPEEAAAGYASGDQTGSGAVAEGEETVRVTGRYCARGHFNAPRDHWCRICGLALSDDPSDEVEGVRPPLGQLIWDNGEADLVTTDTVVGRDPSSDGAVGAGHAVGLCPSGQSEGMSRIHAELRLVGWEVLISDRGSTNGTFLWDESQQAWERLEAGERRPLSIGSIIAFGERTATLESPVSEG